MSDSDPRRTRLLLPLATGIVAVLVTAPARADGPSGVASFGYLHSFVSEPQSSAGNGVEGTFVYYERTMPDHMLGLGGFVRVQNMTPAHLAFDIGPQMNVGPVGVELGYGYRGPYEDRSGMHGVHVGPFLSVGLASLGAHWVLPIAPSGAGEEQGTEFAVTLAFKFFYPVFGELYDMRFGSGLPLGEGPEPRVAPEQPRSDWLADSARGGVQPSTSALPASLREWLAERWLADALDEHAAVAAFTRLSLALLGVGAPLGLVEAAQRAALDEVRHAELCFALAQAYSDRPLGPGGLPGALSPIALRSLEQIALASLRDGCLGEGSAAALADHAARHASDPRVRAAFSEIAGDESQHAELAWRIIDWCLSQGGLSVVVALSEARERLPQLLDMVPVPWPSSLDEAGAQGRFGPVAQMQIFLRIRQQVRERLASVLGQWALGA
jgi:hypothetical protein